MRAGHEVRGWPGERIVILMTIICICKIIGFVASSRWFCLALTFPGQGQVRQPDFVVRLHRLHEFFMVQLRHLPQLQPWPAVWSAGGPGVAA